MANVPTIGFPATKATPESRMSWVIICIAAPTVQPSAGTLARSKELSLKQIIKCRKKRENKSLFPVIFFAASVTTLQRQIANKQRRMQMPTTATVIRNCFPQLITFNFHAQVTSHCEVPVMIMFALKLPPGELATDAKVTSIFCRLPACTCCPW